MKYELKAAIAFVGIIVVQVVLSKIFNWQVAGTFSGVALRVLFLIAYAHHVIQVSERKKEILQIK